MIKDMVKESLLMLMGMYFKGIGRMGLSMAKVSLSLLEKIILLIRVIIRGILRMDSGGLFGQMEMFIRDSLKKILSNFLFI